MKAKLIAMVLGVLTVTAVCGGSAAAMTYAYDGENGTVYITESADGRTVSEYSLSDGSLSEEEKQKLSDWHKEDMRMAVAYLEKYGVSYDAEKDQLLYQGKTVRWLVDEQINQTIVAIQMPEGEIDLYTERAADYTLTGVRVASKEEYDRRTEEEAKARAAATTGAAEAVEIGDYTGKWSDSAQGSLIYSFVFDEDAQPSSPGSQAEGSVEEDVQVTSSDSQSAMSVEEDVQVSNSDSQSAMSVEQEVQVSSAGDRVEGSTEMEVQVISQDRLSGEISEAAAGMADADDSGSEKKKIQEYEKHGIGHGKNGGWIWEGKKVYLLMDEDGSFYQNGSTEAKENKIYLIVKRNADGSIRTVRQMTVEEAMAERILQD